MIPTVARPRGSHNRRPDPKRQTRVGVVCRAKSHVQISWILSPNDLQRPHAVRPARAAGECIRAGGAAIGSSLPCRVSRDERPRQLRRPPARMPASRFRDRELRRAEREDLLGEGRTGSPRVSSAARSKRTAPERAAIGIHHVRCRRTSASVPDRINVLCRPVFRSRIAIRRLLTPRPAIVNSAPCPPGQHERRIVSHVPRRQASSGPRAARRRSARTRRIPVGVARGEDNRVVRSPVAPRDPPVSAHDVTGGPAVRRHLLSTRRSGRRGQSSAPSSRRSKNPIQRPSGERNGASRIR